MGSRIYVAWVELFNFYYYSDDCFKMHNLPLRHWLAEASVLGSEQSEISYAVADKCGDKGGTNSVPGNSQRNSVWSDWHSCRRCTWNTDCGVWSADTVETKSGITCSDLPAGAGRWTWVLFWCGIRSVLLLINSCFAEYGVWCHTVTWLQVPENRCGRDSRILECDSSIWLDLTDMDMTVEFNYSKIVVYDWFCAEWTKEHPLLQY